MLVSARPDHRRIGAASDQVPIYRPLARRSSAMSLNAATIAILISKGLSADDILEVALATEGKADRTNAERQARHREKKKRDNAVTVTALRPPYEVSSTPPVSPVVSEETTPTPKPELKVDHVVEAWNGLAERCGLGRVRKVTEARRRKVATRIRENTIDEFTEAIAAISRSNFLRGENDRGWRADFDWMIEPKNFTKLIEGNYDR